MVGNGYSVRNSERGKCEDHLLSEWLFILSIKCKLAGSIDHWPGLPTIGMGLLVRHLP